MPTRTCRRAATVGLVLALGGCQAADLTSEQPEATAAADLLAGEVPIYEWDPHWPTRPLPNHWALGNVVGVDVDAEDNVWILQRPRTLLHGHEDDASYPIPESECCVPAPAVIVFNQAGDVITSWGGPGSEYEWPQFRGQSSMATDIIREGTVPPGRVGQRTRQVTGPPLDYPWPESEHTLTLDSNGYVWIGNNGGSHVLQMTRDGTFVRAFGRAGASRAERGSNMTDTLNRPAGITVDAEAHEVYIADGYGNRRVIVFDIATGEYRRHWGAYGKRPDDAVPHRRVPFEWTPEDPRPQQFNTAHTVRIDKDGLVYLGDRNNSRIQVFEKDGTFIKEALVKPTTARGSVLDFVFSRDPEQQFIFVVDGRNERVWILRRSDLRMIGEFGHASHFGGGFTVAHNIGIDSSNNLYVTESLEGKRVQRFLYKGLGPRTREYDEYGIATDR